MSDAGNNRLWVIGKCRPVHILDLWDSKVTSVGIQSALFNLPPFKVILHDSVVATLAHLHQTVKIEDNTWYLSRLALRKNSPIEERNLSESVF